MHERPSPPPPPPAAASTLVRLIAAAVLAGLGGVILLVGLGSVADRVPSPQAASARPAAEVAASATATSSGTASPTPSAPIQPAPSGYPVLVGAGDIARCDGDADEATAALVERLPGIVFTLGDNVYEQGTPEEFRECFDPSWGTVKERIRLPVPGNHDYKTRDAAGYREYFGGAAVRDGTTWYSQEVGTWHVVVLDSECSLLRNRCGPDSDQLEWLRRDLALSDARCTLALWHHPRFSSGDHGSDSAVAPFWDALHAAGADLVLNGHEHDYERFAPQDPAGRADPERGITQVIVGTGGAPLRDFKDPVTNSRVRSSLAHGVLSVVLQPSGWAYRFESVDGSFTDQGSGTCH